LANITIFLDKYFNKIPIHDFILCLILIYFSVRIK